jgi:uncharacterized membrane protein YtjA (UPF0391 family)
MYAIKAAVVPLNAASSPKFKGTPTNTGVTRALLICEVHNLHRGRFIMLHWSLVFLVFALIAAVLGFGGLAGAAVGIAKILFFVFLVIWLIAFLTGRRAV